MPWQTGADIQHKNRCSRRPIAWQFCFRQRSIMGGPNLHPTVDEGPRRWSTVRSAAVFACDNVHRGCCIYRVSSTQKQTKLIFVQVTVI